MFSSRYRRILWFFGKAILSFIWWDIILSSVGLRSISRRTRSSRYRKIAAAYRKEAIRMGGVMIKVGQFLSARLDVLPKDITLELAGLQDEVLPETFDDIKKVLEDDLGVLLHEKFQKFDEKPLAAASIGQVHRATIIMPGDDSTINRSESMEVAVKIQRPNIQEIVAIDLSALRVVAGWLMRYPPIKKRANIPGLMEEFSHSLYEEIDYIHEGENAERFAGNFADREDIFVPRVIWSHTSRKVLTLEHVNAIKITDYQSIDAAGISRREVASRLFESYLKQIFDDRFFHADPHPGNLFVLPLGERDGEKPRTWKLVFVDFGMAGEVIPKIWEGLRQGLIAVGTKDAQRVIQAYQTLDVLLPGADLELIKKATQKVFDRLWGKTAPELMTMHASEAQEFIKDFEGLVYDMPFQAPENIVLLVRCLGILSGMCTGLDVDFNIWTNVGPYAQRIIQEGGGLDFKSIITQAVDFLRLLFILPTKVESVLTLLDQGKLELQVPRLEKRLDRIERSNQQIAAAIVFCGFLVSGVNAYIDNQILIATSMGAGALVSLIFLIFRR